MILSEKQKQFLFQKTDFSDVQITEHIQAELIWVLELIPCILDLLKRRSWSTKLQAKIVNNIQCSSYSLFTIKSLLSSSDDLEMHAMFCGPWEHFHKFVSIKDQPQFSFLWLNFGWWTPQIETEELLRRYKYFSYLRSKIHGMLLLTLVTGQSDRVLINADLFSDHILNWRHFQTKSYASYFGISRKLMKKLGGILNALCSQTYQWSVSQTALTQNSQYWQSFHFNVRSSIQIDRWSKLNHNWSS